MFDSGDGGWSLRIWTPNKVPGDQYWLEDTLRTSAIIQTLAEQPVQAGIHPGCVLLLESPSSISLILAAHLLEEQTQASSEPPGQALLPPSLLSQPFTVH